MPRIRVVVWFDRIKETDWRVDSSPQTLEAWREVLGIYPGTRARDPLEPALDLLAAIELG